MTFSLRMQGYEEKTALLEGPYRYVLTRAWSPDPKRALVVMANPSTADALSDDQTIRRLKQLVGDAGYAGFTVVNLFAWRATDPSDVIFAAECGRDVVGPSNDAHIRDELTRHEVVIAAWGSSTWKTFADRRTVVRYLVEKAGRTLLCFGFTKEGAPRHPSRLPRTAALEAFA